MAHNIANDSKEKSSVPGHPPVPQKGVEDVDEKQTQRSGSRREGNNADSELPPNENLRKNADEAYGDTEIPRRKHDV
jgi:hypothetical protein